MEGGRELGDRTLPGVDELDTVPAGGRRIRKGTLGVEATGTGTSGVEATGTGTSGVEATGTGTLGVEATGTECTALHKTLAGTAKAV